MSSVKNDIIQIIRKLPDDVTVDDVMAELYFKMAVDAGLQELDEGKGIPHEQAKKRLAKWLKR